MRSRVSPALVVALIALVFAVGGTSYAVSALPRNSVGTKQIKKHAVTTPKLASSASARIAGLTYKKLTLDIPAQAAGAITVPCPSDLTAIGGGVETPHTVTSFMLDSHPTTTGWQLSVGNSDTVKQTFSVYAVCAKVSGAPKIAAAAASSPRFVPFMSP